MHPLELFDRFRRWFGWLSPGRQLWDRNPQQVAPDRSDDWLLEPASIEEACLLFPHLDEERALLRYQQLRLEMRERDDRGFDCKPSLIAFECSPLCSGKKKPPPKAGDTKTLLRV